MGIVVLTNDDGIDAPGLRSLRAACPGSTVLLAPDTQLSGCGHRVTTQQSLVLEQRGEGEFCLNGTPADCARLAIAQLYDSVDWVLSGINAGGNLGVDVYISGTVAAVREAAMHGIPAIAISHWIRRPLPVDWDRATGLAQSVLAELMARSLPLGGFWNVNLPHLDPGSPEPDLVFCAPSTEPLPVAYRREGNSFTYAGVYADRDRAPGSDVDVCFSGNIAVTQLSL